MTAVLVKSSEHRCNRGPDMGSSTALGRLWERYLRLVEVPCSPYLPFEDVAVIRGCGIITCGFVADNIAKMDGWIRDGRGGRKSCRRHELATRYLPGFDC